MLSKTSTALFIFILLALHATAQRTPEQRIEDSVIGWWNNTRFDHLKSPTNPLGKKKELYINKIVEWVKKTYTPVAGLGTYNRYINKLGYGVLFEVWNVSHDKAWTEPNGNFKPISEENTPFWVGVNKTFGSFPIPFLQKENEYYFTMQPDGYANDRSVSSGPKPDPRIHPNVYKYVTWCNDWQTVYLTPNNKLPFIAITKGELLQKAAMGLDNQWAYEVKDVQAKWPNDKKTQDEVLVVRKQNIEKYRSNIQQLKERYQSSLNEPAVIRDMQPTMYSFQLDPDIFKIDMREKQLNQAYQVYKVDTALYAKMQTETPQWVAIAFPFANKEKGNQLNELYTSLSQNFNYDYVYNYFFEPEKIKGQTYKPANEEQLIARLSNYRKNNADAIHPTTYLIAFSGNIFFFDDFSSSIEGNDPANWYFKKFGKHAVTVRLKDQPGKWVQLGYNVPVSPSLLQRPLPENFTLEYDIVTDADFLSRTGGAVTLALNTRAAGKDGTELMEGDGTRLSVEITAGNENDYNSNNYRGVAKIKINSTPAINKENYAEGLLYEYALHEFTNKKIKVHIAINVKNNVLTVLINNKAVAQSADFKMTYGGKCTSCGVPSGTRFNTITWNNSTNDPDNIKVYISNVKIIKE
jgi:hypothetical protein